MPVPRTLIYALACALGLLAAPARPTAPQAGRESIEQLLERQRQQRILLLARLNADLTTYMDAFARLVPPVAPERASELRSRLTGLGREAAELLVPWLEPGPEPDEVAALRANVAAEALAEIADLTVTDDLLALLASGSDAARHNALRALQSCPEPERVRPALMAIFDGPDESLRAPALLTLVRVGGTGNAELFRRVLSSPDKQLVQLGLQALIDTGDTSAAPQVRELLARPSGASQHVPALLAYYQSQPQAVDDDVLALWVQLVPRVPAARTRLLILETLPDLVNSSSSELKRLLEPLTKGGDPMVNEAALIALARLGDRNARREALRPHDDFVKQNERFGEAYLRRAQVLMRMHDWDEATKDFQTALRVSRDDTRPLGEAYVGLARAYALRGKLKDAAEWLRKAPIQMRELRELADDPDFRELRESRYGKDVWGV